MQHKKNKQMDTPRYSFIIETRWTVIITGILLFAFLLRIWGLNSESAWIDEAFSIVLAEHSPVDIIQGTAADQHPPFYYLLLHVWLWFGKSVLHARLLSVIIGVIGVYQAIIFGRKIGGNTLGLLSGILIAASPMHIWYSQEARMYILLCSLTTASSYYLWRNLREDKIMGCFFYGLLSLLSLYTHYFSIFVIVAQGTWLFFFAIAKKQSTHLLHWFMSTILAGILFIPWIPTALYQSQEHSLTWLSTPSLSEVIDVFLRVIFGSSIIVLPYWGRILLLILVFSAVLTTFLTIKKPAFLNYSFLGWISMIPFFLVVLISLNYPIFQYKQFLIILIPLLIWLGATILNIPKIPGLIFLSVILIFASATNIYQTVSITKDDWKGATQYIQTNIHSEDVIFGNPAAILLALSVYQQNPLPFTGYPTNYNIIKGGWEGQQISENIANTVLSHAIQGKERLWLVEFTPEFWDPEHQLEKWLEMNGEKIDEQFFGRIRIRLFSFYGY